jgi:hypothetical protein
MKLNDIADQFEKVQADGQLLENIGTMLEQAVEADDITSDERSAFLAGWSIGMAMAVQLTKDAGPKAQAPLLLEFIKRNTEFAKKGYLDT